MYLTISSTVVVGGEADCGIVWNEIYDAERLGIQYRREGTACRIDTIEKAQPTAPVKSIAHSTVEKAQLAAPVKSIAQQELPRWEGAKG